MKGRIICKGCGMGLSICGGFEKGTFLIFRKRNKEDEIAQRSRKDLGA